MPRAFSGLVSPAGTPGVVIEVYTFGPTSPSPLGDSVYIDYLLSPFASVHARLTPAEAEQLADLLVRAAAEVRAKTGDPSTEPPAEA